MCTERPFCVLAMKTKRVRRKPTYLHDVSISFVERSRNFDHKTFLNRTKSLRPPKWCTYHNPLDSVSGCKPLLAMMIRSETDCGYCEHRLGNPKLLFLEKGSLQQDGSIWIVELLKHGFSGSWEKSRSLIRHGVVSINDVVCNDTGFVVNNPSGAIIKVSKDEFRIVLID